VQYDDGGTSVDDVKTRIGFSAERIFAEQVLDVVMSSRTSRISGT
jgi:hypothetical protein